MSTFNGIIEEFPDIRIDHFRRHPDKSPPQACFLSHVHSDHLQGLESLKMPFVYCSAATKSILLRMEKYPHRINFAKGILEARKQTYRSLRSVLRALPLETPVEIELSLKSKIRVTLFDANHCPGAVMFLIENVDKAILHTGDIRSETWWVNSLVRNPVLLPYVSGVKRLNCMYLDTTFASRHEPYEEFPTKADGLKELLGKVSKCPSDTLFYFRSWTLGYEDVWVALSNFLHSPIHVDAYQLRIFKSLADSANSVDRGPVLAGFSFGNHHQVGCLTDDSTVSVHSCEPGTDCHDRIKKTSNVVWITPIISRLKDGTEIAEIGAGGGGGDLYQTPELELIDENALEALTKFCGGSSLHQQAISRLGEALSVAKAKGDTNIALEGVGLGQDEEVTLKRFVQLISRRDEEARTPMEPDTAKIIHFPYSRHSSFSELRHLVSLFRPKDVCPCTVDIDNWTEEVSMQSLFGDLCSEDRFRHDEETRLLVSTRQAPESRKRKRDHGEYDSQETATQTSIEAEEVFRSAETSMRKTNEQGQMPQDSHHGQDSGKHHPHIAQPPQTTLMQQAEDGLQTHPEPEHYSPIHLPQAVQKLHAALGSKFEGKGNRQDDPTVSNDSTDENGGTNTGQVSENRNLSKPTTTEPSNSKPNSDLNPDPDPGLDLTTTNPVSTPIPPSRPTQDLDPTTSTTPTPTTTAAMLTNTTEAHLPSQLDSDPDHTSLDKSRLDSRVTAYLAAKSALDNRDPTPWTDLRLRSLGWKGHTEEEIEL